MVFVILHVLCLQSLGPDLEEFKSSISSDTRSWLSTKAGTMPPAAECDAAARNKEEGDSTKSKELPLASSSGRLQTLIGRVSQLSLTVIEGVDTALSQALSPPHSPRMYLETTEMQHVLSLEPPQVASGSSFFRAHYSSVRASRCIYTCDPEFRLSPTGGNRAVSTGNSAIAQLSASLSPSFDSTGWSASPPRPVNADGESSSPYVARALPIPIELSPPTQSPRNSPRPDSEYSAPSGFVGLPVCSRCGCSRPSGLVVARTAEEVERLSSQWADFSPEVSVAIEFECDPVVMEMHKHLVPTVVSNESFWRRFLFSLHLLHKQEAQLEEAMSRLTSTARRQGDKRSLSGGGSGNSCDGSNRRRSSFLDEGDCPSLVIPPPAHAITSNSEAVCVTDGTNYNAAGGLSQPLFEAESIQVPSNLEPGTSRREVDGATGVSTDAHDDETLVNITPMVHGDQVIATATQVAEADKIACRLPGRGSHPESIEDVVLEEEDIRWDDDDDDEDEGEDRPPSELPPLLVAVAPDIAAVAQSPTGATSSSTEVVASSDEASFPVQVPTAADP
eukprot:GHVT01044493.1.p1 GENE.GHVT01044493.1~~GHVT01044493.1.p1  ORF type:complete len:561 (-),score=98.58 GHVT01044493.1:879-2561(-)